MKITERKFAAGPAGPDCVPLPAHVHHRARAGAAVPRTARRVRRHERRAPRPRDAARHGAASSRGVTAARPANNPRRPTARACSSSRRVLGAPFPFKVVAVDVENNVVEFAAPLVFIERDHNVPTGARTASSATPTTRTPPSTASSTSTGQRVAFAPSAGDRRHHARDHALTFRRRDSRLPPSAPRTTPRFAPVLDEAQVVVPGDERTRRRRRTVTGHATRRTTPRRASRATRRRCSSRSLDTPPMSFAGKGDRSGGFVTPSLNVTGLSRADRPDRRRPGEGHLTAACRLLGRPVLRRHQREAVRADPAAEACFGRSASISPKVPTFVTQTLDVAHDAAAERPAAPERGAAASQAQLGARGDDR